MSAPEGAGFTEGTLGRTARRVFRLGLASSYGIGAAGVEEAIERGVNYLYWGSMRRSSFGEGIRNAVARGRREKLIVAVQSYTRAGFYLRPSLCRALSSLGLDYADILILGLWNRPPPPRILDAALKLREGGLARHLALSTHQRPLVAALAGSNSPIDVFHLRYNAAHRGAEREVFPALPAEAGARPGIVSFTATRWGALLKPVRGADGARVPTAGDCYRFVLANPKVDVVIAGPRDTADLRHALAALERGPMDEDELAWIRAYGDRVYAAAGTGLLGRLLGRD